MISPWTSASLASWRIGLLPRTAAKTDKDRNFYENTCAHLDREIDALVYQLYGLTGEEIRIVESMAT